MVEKVEHKIATKQAAENRRRKPSPINGQILPAGFEAHPERRHNGAWKKESTVRYKLEKMMELTEQELLEVVQNPDAPYFERKLANCINKGDWKTIEGMINQVYGFPKQSVESIDLTPPKPLSPRKQLNDKSES